MRDIDKAVIGIITFILILYGLAFIVREDAQHNKEVVETFLKSGDLQKCVEGR